MKLFLMIFFEQFHGQEPPRKKAHVVKSVPYTMGKKPHTAVKVARKTTFTASTSEQDPDYEPPQGGNSDEESDTEDVINPLIDQEF